MKAGLVTAIDLDTDLNDPATLKSIRPPSLAMSFAWRARATGDAGG